MTQWLNSSLDRSKTRQVRDPPRRASRSRSRSARADVGVTLRLLRLRRGVRAGGGSARSRGARGGGADPLGSARARRPAGLGRARRASPRARRRAARATSRRRPRRLAGASAAPIGLESYRRDRLARDLAAAGPRSERRCASTALRSRGATSPTPGARARRSTSPPCSSRAATERKPRPRSRARGRGEPRRRASTSRRTACASPSLAATVPARAPSPGRFCSKRRSRTARRPRIPPCAARCAPRRRGSRPADRGRRGRALVAAGDARRGVAALSRRRPARWPAEERARTCSPLARGQAQLERPAAALATAARIPEDGSPASFEARLLRAELELEVGSARRGAAGRGRPRSRRSTIACPR